jgi:tRNA dimethylallyltransferase
LAASDQSPDDDRSEARPLVRVICGPTAAGKSHAAMLCARLADVAVVSADSRQVYRGFDVGTAKPGVRDLLAAPHFGVDVLEPTERASAAWWAQAADGWIRDARALGRVPVVAGGTGLYLRALFGELFDEPPMDPERRVALQGELAGLSVGELRRWTERLDPARAALGRTQLLRAVEVALLTGRRVSELHRERPTMPRWRARYLVVDPGPSLPELIADRAHTMFSQGWPEEVRTLIASVRGDAPAWNASGYRTVRDMVQGRISTHDARERVIIETRQYAKRQRTWFRHQLAGADVTRLDAHAAGFEAELRQWWDGAPA